MSLWGLELGVRASCAVFVSWWGGQGTRRGEHEQGVANGWLRVGLGATDLSVHRSLGSTVFAVGDDYAHTSRHIVSRCVCSRVI